MIGMFLFQSFVLFPILSAIVGRKTLSKTQKLLYASGFIFAVATALSIWRVQSWQENYFQVLGVPRSAEVRDIKQAYRRLSTELHPDKNPSEEARQRFLRVTQAQNTLLNDDTRDAYDRWGEQGIKWVETSQSVSLQGLMNFALSLFSEFVLVYILTTGVSSTNARSYAYGFLGMMVFVIAGMRFGDEDIPIPFAPSMTRNEKCDLLRDSLGIFVLGIGAWQRAMYFDWEEKMRLLLREIEIQHYAILQRANLGPSAAPSARARAGAQQVPPPEPPAQRFRFPDIPSWMYILLFVLISQFSKSD